MKCPYAPKTAPAVSYDTVNQAMQKLMPGWFTKMDETMDADEPFTSIHAIQNIASRNPDQNLDDIIHEYFKEDWFDYHEDGDEDW